MNVTPTLYALGTCLLAAAAVAPGTASPSRFEAHTTGTAALTLSGAAEFGPVDEPLEMGRFVITLGAQSPAGAVIFTRPALTRPEPGVYRLADAPGAIRALVVTGSATRPTGAFHARSGTLTITTSTDEVVAGRFEIDARGYTAAEPGDEDRPLTVRGTFTATPGR